MKVYVFPADQQGCGKYRLIWPSEALQALGHDVVIVSPDARDSMLQGVMDGDTMVDVHFPADADVMVFQRVTHRHIKQALALIRQRGVAVVVDMDDDLSCIDPRNPAYTMLHPKNTKGNLGDHSWANAQDACLNASMVTVSTPALLKRYAPRGNGQVYNNYVPARMLGIPHHDSNLVGWGGSVHSHPGDLQDMGSSVNRLAQEGVEFGVIGNGEGVREAWGLPEARPLHVAGVVPIDQWGHALTGLGIGVAPLADTKFNAAKSWLKMAEMASVGVPCVASDRADYRRLHDTYGVGIIVNKPNEWYRQLKELAGSKDLREDLSGRGRVAMMGLTIEENAWRLWEIWSDALKREREVALGAWSRR